MWKLSIIDDGGQSTVVNLVRDEYTVGRAEGNAIRLAEQNVSRLHCIVRKTALGYRVEDKSSYNGVFVNGVRVIGGHDLGHRDVIQLGDYRIELVDESLDTQEQNHRPFPELIPPASGRLPHRLVVLIGPEQGHEFPLYGERHLLGRGDECDIRLDHASVSRVHAEVRLVADGQFEVVDKASANGLRVNGRELPRTLLDSRDVLELGDVVLKYIPQGQVFHVGPTEGERIATLGGSHPPPSRALPPNLRASIFAALVGALVAAAIGGAYLSGTSDGPKRGSAGSHVALSPIERAIVLLEQGAHREAHKVVSTLPLDSVDRHSPEFVRIEEAWAKETLRAAAREPDRETKRSILQEVAQTASVSAELRNQAAEALRRFDAEAIDLSDLGTSQSATR